MSRTQTHVIYGRQNHLPTPDEIKFRSGSAVVTSSAVTPANADIAGSVIETANRTGQSLLDHVIDNPSDGKLLTHDQLYTKRVRNRWTGEIIATYDRVYQWTRRSITYLSRDELIAHGVTYPIDPRVGELIGRPSDTVDGNGAVNRATTVHFPFDVEVYDPTNPGDLLGPDIDYTVVFFTWDGTVISTQTVKPGGSAIAPPSPVRPGTTFVGWSEDFINVQRDLLIRPVYANDEFVVTWVDWNAVVLKTELVKFSNAATPPSDPSRIGHDFYGWDTDYTFILGTTTITAQYIPHQFTVTFIDWNNDFLVDKIVNYGESPTNVFEPIREHHDFAGWDKDFTSVTHDMTVMATYTLKKFRVTYRDPLNGNAVIKIDIIEYGKASIAPAWPWSEDEAYKGYELIGWDGAIDVIVDNIAVFAVMRKRQMEITVIDQLTNEVIRMQYVPYGHDFKPFPPPDHSDRGQDFNGWAPEPGGELISITKNTIVYAKYTIAWVHLAFLAENGAHVDPPEVYYQCVVRYGWTLTMENTRVPGMYNSDKTMIVEYWYYFDQVAGKMAIMTADTPVFYDMFIYPRFALK